MTEMVVFAVFALVALISAIVVVAHRNPVYSTMSLVITLLATAVLFVLLGSPFLAVLQVLLYTGAILVLFLFVIMLLNVQRERSMISHSPGQTAAAAISAVLLFAAAGRLLWEVHGSARPASAGAVTSVAELAGELFSTYVLPFEIIGFLLLVAVVAASWVAKRPDGDSPEDLP